MFAHTITLCLVTTLHGQPKTVCPTIIFERAYTTEVACSTQIPSDMNRWWPEAKLLQIKPEDIQSNRCEKVRRIDDDEGGLLVLDRSQ